MVNKGVGSHGQFDRLYVLPVRDRDCPLHCRCFYLSGISLVQEMAGEKKRAIEALRKWQGKKNQRNRMLRTGLKVAYYMPNGLNQGLYKLRLKIF